MDNPKFTMKIMNIVINLFDVFDIYTYNFKEYEGYLESETLISILLQLRFIRKLHNLVLKALPDNSI